MKKQLQTARSQLDLHKASGGSGSGEESHKADIDELNTQLSETKRVNEEFRKEKGLLENQVDQLKTELENRG